MAVLTAPARPAATSSGPASTDRGAGFGAALAAAGSESAPTETAGTMPAEVGIPASGADDTGAESQSDGAAMAVESSTVDAMRPAPWGAFTGFAWTTSAAGEPATPATDASGPVIASESVATATLSTAREAMNSGGAATAVTASAVAGVATADPITRGRDAGAPLHAPPSSAPTSSAPTSWAPAA
ncbi:MAG: hypothetical protein ABWX62_00075 [Microterricola sp.]